MMVSNPKIIFFLLATAALFFTKASMAFSPSLLLNLVGHSKLENGSSRIRSNNGVKANTPTGLVCPKRYRKPYYPASSTIIEAQMFHPDVVEPAVVVSSVYWDNIKAKIVTVLGVEVVLILVGVILLGTIVNQLPKFLSDLIRSEEENGKQDPEKMQLLQR